MHAPIQFRVFGAPSLVVPDGRADPRLVLQPRRLAILAYLTLGRPRGMHARDTLIAMFWPRETEEHGRRALRNALHALRQGLGDDVIRTAGHGAVGVESGRIRCDLLDLESELAAGRFDAALARYEGEILQGFHVSGAPAFDDWLSDLRRRVAEDVASAARSQAIACRARGDLPGAVCAAERAFAIAPDNERALRELVELLDASGNRAAALTTYQAFAGRLRAEYDAEPAPETVALAGRVRGRAPAVPTVDAQAYVLYVRGTYHFLRAAHGGHPDELHASRSHFEQALERDPDFALALAGLSNYYASGAARNMLKPFHEHFGRAIELSRQALVRDPSLAVPHVHFGVQAMFLESDWERAGREFALAAALEPHYAEGRRFYGVYLGFMGRREESIRELREAVRLEPEMAIFRNSLADAYMVAGQLDAAIDELRRALQLDPAYGAARDRLLRTLERTGRYEEALSLRESQDSEAARVFRRAWSAGGPEGYCAARRDELSAWLRAEEARLLEQRSDNAGDLLIPPELKVAQAHAELGDPRRAFEWEQRACAAAPGRRRWFTSRPELASLDPFRRRAAAAVQGRSRPEP